MALCTLSVMFSVETGPFRSRVSDGYRFSNAFQIEHGFGNITSIPALVMVIERKSGAEPTEFVSIPAYTVPDRDWRTWPGPEFNKTFVSDERWMHGFTVDYFTMVREGMKLRAAATIRKGSMIRSDRLSPPPRKRHPGSPS